MKTYAYQIKVSAPSENQAQAIINALGTLAGKLTDKELLKLADIVANDPQKTALAKKALGV